MKFIVEIRSDTAEGAGAIERRFTITAISPSFALRQARSLLLDWRERHPSQADARLLDAKGVELYKVSE